MKMKKTDGRKGLAFTATVLRLLRTNRDSSEFSSYEKTVHAIISADNQGNYQRRIGTAWLDMERKKAEALMGLQRRRVL